MPQRLRMQIRRMGCIVALKAYKAARWFRIRAYGLFRRVIPIPLSVDQQEFLQANATFWRALSNGNEGGDRAGYVLVPVENHPIICMSDASFASIVARAKHLRMLFLVNAQPTSVAARLLESYPDATLVYRRGWRYLFVKLLALLPALRAYRKIKTPADLLHFRVDGVRFGDAIYDAVLAGGYATVNAIDRRVLWTLWEFYFLRLVIEDVIGRYPIRTAVLAHLVGLPGSTISRHLLRHGIEVLSRVGSHQILIKRYRSLVDVGIYPAKPERGYFELMMANEDGSILRPAEEYIERRFDHDVDDVAAGLAFNAAKRTFSDRQSFCAQYGLDVRKPVVFVMLHAFNDYPHSHFARPMIFQDYYHWFMRTLQIAKITDDVNWIFKDHPAAWFYPTKDLHVEALFAQNRYNHIRFLRSDADFNARSLRHLAHAVLTCIGTAGLEYATVGIPCVLGGESAYSGFGFTIEPEDEHEYEACLKNIRALKPLSGAQVKAAKIVAYFYFCILQGAVYHFCPYFSDDEVSKWNKASDNRLWRLLVAQLRNEQHVDLMRRQAGRLSDFILDPSWTQYVDLEKFPFLRPSVPARSFGG